MDISVQAFLDAIQDHHILRLGPAEYLQVQHLLEVRPDLNRAEFQVALASLLATNQEQWQQIVRLFKEYYPDIPPNGSLKGAGSSTTRTSAQLYLRWLLRKMITLRVLCLLLLLLLSFLIYARLDGKVVLYNAGAVLYKVGAVLYKVGAVLYTWLLRSPQEQSGSRPSKPQPLSTKAQDQWILQPFLAKRVQQVEWQPPLRSLDWCDWLAGALAVLLVLVGLRWLRLPSLVTRARQAQAVARQRRISLERRRLAEQAERDHAPITLTYQVERYAPLDDQAIGDAASLLGQLFHAVKSDDLNGPATVRTSIDAGGRLIPIYAYRSVAHELTVLVDVEHGDHPWLAGITWVLERWQALGVHFARFDFCFNPLFVTTPATGTACMLQHLARRVDGAPLVVISRMLSTHEYHKTAGWLEEFNAWPVKAWLDPDPRPLSERLRERQEILRLERQYGLQRFPFSAEGLLALARYLAEDGQEVSPPAWPSLLPLGDVAVAEALPKWALLAALVPDATWGQLEAIRRHFPELNSALPEPRYVQRLLDWVAREDHEHQPESEDGRTLRLSPGLVERLIRQQRELDARQTGMQSLEARGRQFLLRQLDVTRPNDELLRQLCELKRVAHRLYLEPEHALAMVAPLLGSAVEEELLQVVKTELERGNVLPRFEPRIRDHLDLMVGRVKNLFRPGELLGRPWRAWGEPALVILGIMLLAAFLIWYGPADLHTWLLRPPSQVTTFVSPAIQSVVKSGAKQTIDKPMTVTNSIGMTFVLMLPGEFRMGSDDKNAEKDEKPVHTVHLMQDFYLSKYEVTQGQWQAVMGNNPNGFTDDANRPVEGVSWLTVQEFISRLNQREREKQYRLPTEAEWEYAARAGSTTVYSFGNDAGQLGDYAWYKTNAGGTSHPVGQKRPNAWGLHDMYGNVWEWVQDWYGVYPVGPVVDPAGPQEEGSTRVVRGGSLRAVASRCRSAHRNHFNPNSGFNYATIGFRLVMTGP